MAIEVEKVGDSLLRIKDGIFETLRCTKCGKNLPLFEWECPNCAKAERRDK
jgi:lipopolysaccharide biosynthesis regulator YciM